METAELQVDVTGGIATVTFNRPAQRNALTFAMYEGLAEVCDKASVDSAIKVVLVKGAGGKAFAAGTDIALFRDFKTAEQALAYENKMTDILSRIEACRVPTVAALTGACTGGGAAIAAVCDIRIADNNLKFGVPIARTLGNCLSAWNLARLSQMIGMARTKDLLLTSRLMGADEALRIGFVRDVFATPEEAVEQARALAHQLTEHAPLTMHATKEALRRLQTAEGTVDDQDLIVSCYTSSDFREGMEAFLAKRKPEWRGE